MYRDNEKGIMNGKRRQARDCERSSSIGRAHVLIVMLSEHSVVPAHMLCDVGVLRGDAVGLFFT